MPTKTKSDPKTKSAPKATPTITEKIANLDAAVEWFYSDDFALDQAATHYQAATALAQEILSDLDQLKNQITQIDQDFTKEA